MIQRNKIKNKIKGSQIHILSALHKWNILAYLYYIKIFNLLMKIIKSLRFRYFEPRRIEVLLTL